MARYHDVETEIADDGLVIVPALHRGDYVDVRAVDYEGDVPLTVRAEHAGAATVYLEEQSLTDLITVLSYRLNEMREWKKANNASS